MDDKELERILAEIRNRNTDDINEAPLDPPKHSETEPLFKETVPEAPTRTESPKIEDDIFSIIEEKNPEDIVEDIKHEVEEAPEFTEEITEPEQEDITLDGDEEKPKSDILRKAVIALIALVVIAAIGAGVYFGFFHGKGDNKESTTASTTVEETSAATEEITGALNPLTGEKGFNSKAVGKRPVAVVVENEYSAESVRPQWGMNNADIVLEAETEFSTRLLFFWADYTKMPEQIGPTRSARPPFIRFSQLFDSVFIHAGLSHSKDNYVGADSVFESENVDHINLLRFDETGNFFGRDRSRGGSVEHTGYLNGNNVEALLEKEGVNTKADDSKYTKFEFNKKAKKLSDENANTVRFTWTDTNGKGHCPKIGKFEYLEDEKKYTTYDFDSSNGEADVQFENLIFLLDETEYIVKHNYKSAGNSETYCDYKLAGGKGVVVSEGTYINITWDVEDGKLVLKNEKGKTVKLNPGKSYIGYGSSNYGGKVTINPED